jgi:starvation-inducible outer membrane lipoprotein
MKKSLVMMVVNLLLLAGCTWVHVSPSGEKVRVLSAAEVTGCEKVGVTTVSLLGKVVGVKRSKKKVAMELVTLGRNSGAEMGGDTIVPVSEIINGEQSFEVFRCIGR